jgi:hypothetical protein
MFVSRIVIDDQVEIQAGRHGFVQVAQKGEELLMTVTWFAFRPAASSGPARRPRRSGEAPHHFRQ